MAIRQIGQGKYQVDVYEGKKRRRLTFECSYEDAVKREADLLKYVGKEEVEPTLEKFRDQYLNFCANQKGYVHKKNVVGLLIKEFGALRLSQINIFRVETYQSKLLKDGLKPATVNRRIATLKHMISKAVDWKLTPDNTLTDIRKVKMLRENNRRLRYLTDAESEKLIYHAGAEYRAKYLQPIVITALNTGMRLSEILKLKWENVDMLNGFVHVGDTKTFNSRTIPMSEILKQTLASLVRRIDIPWVFHDNGKRLQSVKKAFNSACKKAGIIDFHFHDLRHTFASVLAMNGETAATIQQILGHKTLAMTSRYTHLSPGHIVNAIKKLDKKVVTVVNYNSQGN